MNKRKNKAHFEFKVSHILVVVFVFSFLLIGYLSLEPIIEHKIVEDSIYAQKLDKILEERKKIKKDFRLNRNPDAYLTKVAEYIGYTITNTLFDDWYGTPYDFNGNTTIPQSGHIACGYFVTTILEHAQFDLDRVWYAQQASSVLIDAICGNDHVIKFDNLNSLEWYINKSQTNLFLVGLDTHVGFLWKDGADIYIVHAAQSGGYRVSKQKIKNASVMLKSNLFYLGNLLNASTIRKWIKHQKF